MSFPQLVDGIKKKVEYQEEDPRMTDPPKKDPPEPEKPDEIPPVKEPGRAPIPEEFPVRKDPDADPNPEEIPTPLKPPGPVIFPPKNRKYGLFAFLHYATPLARKIAADLNIDLQGVKGFGVAPFNCIKVKT